MSSDRRPEARSSTVSISPWTWSKNWVTCLRWLGPRTPGPVRWSTKKRYPLSVGMRPALVWGWTRYPSRSRATISERTVAEETCTPGALATWEEPTGSAVPMYSVTTASKIAARRSFRRALVNGGVGVRG